MAATRPRRFEEEKGPVEVAEEAFQLLRFAPASCLVGYYLGTLPFVLALLYFWSDMARSAFASERLLTGTLGLSVLFIWMKAWHGIFAQRLLAQLCGEPAPALSVREFLRTALHQAIVQPLGLFLLPISVALLVPLGWVYAFFTSATVFSSTAPDIRTLLKKSWDMTRLWSMQGHYLVFLFKLFGFFVFINVMAAIGSIPMLMKTLLGIETVISQSPWTLMNTTILAAAACLTFLCIDPVLKASYVLRCFYGESLRTGQDLKAELKAVSGPVKVAVVAALLFAFTLGAPQIFGAEHLERPQKTMPAAPTSVTPPALDRSIDEVIQRREYSWRLPRETGPRKEKPASELNFLESFFNKIEAGLKEIQRWVRDLSEWLGRRGTKTQTRSFDGLNIAGAIRGIIYLLLIALALLLIWFLVRLWRNRDRFTEVTAEALPAMPDVSDENVGAEQLPEDGWIQMARELFERGELRLALRAFYLATLANLAERNLITLARFKSNRDYERELTRRGHALQQMPGLFSENVATFERVWYGLHEVTPEVLQHFSGNVEKIKTGA